MNGRFQDIVDKMPLLLEQLQHCPLLKRDNLGTVPEHGVYVFYENRQPIYVGRSNRMRERIQEHGRLGSRHNTAPFAFNLTRDMMKQAGAITGNETRGELESLPEFVESFLAQKARVSEMEVRTVGIADQVKQALFEIYASFTLGTKYNDFATH